MRSVYSTSKPRLQDSGPTTDPCWISVKLKIALKGLNTAVDPGVINGVISMVQLWYFRFSTRGSILSDRYLAHLKRTKLKILSAKDTLDCPCMSVKMYLDLQYILEESGFTLRTLTKVLFTIV